MRYTFAQINNQYFCYFGCSTFKVRHELEGHLLTNHQGSLHLWGLSERLLQQRNHGQPKEDQIDHSLDFDQVIQINEISLSNVSAKQPNVSLIENESARHLPEVNDFAVQCDL